MHEWRWITIFGSRVRRFANNFHAWRSHAWKSLANRITSDQKLLFMVTNVLLYFLHAILCPGHTIPLKKNNYWSLISTLSLRTVFSDLAMMTSSNANIFRATGPLFHRSSVGSPHKDQWRGALMFSLIWAWINDWVNKREACDRRRHRAHYEVIVMALWRHHSWSVTPHECGALTLWRHIRRLFLNAQIGANAIFTSELQPWISISHHPVFTA